ncbi:MAG: alpha-2-macroglobulin family protein, partial [Candidatus Baltobacteraceae bacterium]
NARAASGAPIPCASGITSADGTLRIYGDSIQRCYVGDRPAQEAPELLVVAKRDADWSYVRTYSYSGAYDYSVNAGWSSGQPESRGEIYSDRQMYQPGEKAQLTGVAYFVQNGILSVDRNALYRLKITDPSGAVTTLDAQKTNSFGTFAFGLPLKQDQALGYYSIEGTGENGNRIDGQIRVAQFKPPNFKVALSLDASVVSAGSSVRAEGVGTYLFGAPLEGGKAHVYVTRDIAAIAPKGWDTYAFGRHWFWPQEQPSFQSDVLEQDAPLDRQGAAAQQIAVPADLPFAMTYQVDFQATDISNLAVADSQTFTAYPSRQLIGVQSDFIATAGQTFPVKIIVTDPAGAPLSGVAVHVELQAMNYASATQLIEGGEQAKNAVQFVTVDKADLTSGAAAQIVGFRAVKPGAFRIVANLAGAKSEATSTDTQIYITGQSEVGWNSENPNQLKIALDKSRYKPGDTATALIASPYRRADLYIAVVRHDLIYKQVIHLNGGAPRVHFRVTPEMVPNAAVQAVLVRRGAPLQTLKAGELDGLVKIGMVPLSIDLSDKYLRLKITPAAARLEPAVQQRVNFALTDGAGKPAAGELTIMVVNEAVLQLTGYRPPDLVKIVFADQSISTRFADSRFNVVLKPLTPPVEKGWGYGGGFMAGAAGTRVRTNFQALAYFNGALKTDADGRASVSFRLPDDLTTWRVMAVATGSDDFHFAHADATFLTTKPLITNALLPQFARPGDIIEAGLSVSNATGKDAVVNLFGSLSGGLRFLSNDSQTLHLDTSIHPGMNGLRYPIEVGSAGSSRMSFVTRLGSATDAFAFPLAVRTAQIGEQTIDSGSTQSRVSIPIDLRGGTLQLTLASSMLPQLTVPAEQMIAQDNLPFSESAASRLMIAAALLPLEESGKAALTFDPSAQIAGSLAALLRLQRADGGFSAWDGSPRSDPFVTPYAARSLGFARSGGAEVSGAAITALKAYLRKSLADPTRFQDCKTAACDAQIRLDDLTALAALGDTRNDFLSDIYEQRNSLDAVNQIMLARYLLAVGGWQAQGRALAATLRQNIYLSGRYANANLPQRWSWLDSPTAAQAQMLGLLIEQKAPAFQIDGAVSALLAQQCRCGWQTAYDTAQAVRALSEYDRTQPQNPDFSATAAIAGATVATVSFGRATAVSKTFNLSAETLRGSAIELRKQGAGSLHYVAAYNYQLAGAQPGIFAGLRVIREIRAAGQTDPLATLDFARLTAPLAITSGRVFEITVRCIADHPIDNVIITDPLPAGLEAVDSTFKTSTQALIPQSDSWQIDYQTIYKDRIVAFASHLGPGVYELHYVVRSVTPGIYRWPGAEAQLQYAPEQFGRSASTLLKIT